MVPKGIDMIPDNERKLLIELAQIATTTDDKLSMQRLAALIRIRARARYKDNLDSRVLIGVRVPKPRADLYRSVAEKTDRSLYRFVLDALDHEACAWLSTGSDSIPGGQQNECFVHQGNDVQTKQGGFDPETTRFDVQTDENRPFSTATT